MRGEKEKREMSLLILFPQRNSRPPIQIVSQLFSTGALGLTAQRKIPRAFFPIHRRPLKVSLSRGSPSPQVLYKKNISKYATVAVPSTLQAVKSWPGHLRPLSFVPFVPEYNFCTATPSDPEPPCPIRRVIVQTNHIQGRE